MPHKRQPPSSLGPLPVLIRWARAGYFCFSSHPVLCALGADPTGSLARWFLFRVSKADWRAGGAGGGVSSPAPSLQDCSSCPCSPLGSSSSHLSLEHFFRLRWQQLPLAQVPGGFAISGKSPSPTYSSINLSSFEPSGGGFCFLTQMAARSLCLDPGQMDFPLWTAGLAPWPCQADQDCFEQPAGVQGHPPASGSLARLSRNHTSFISCDLSHQLRALQH